MKRLIALMAMLLLLVGSQSLMAKTIYFYNSSKWATPYVYAWVNSVGDASHNAAWPGEKFTQIETTPHGATVYKIVLSDSYDLDRVKFSNNGSETQRTADLVLIDGSYYNCSGPTTLESIEREAGVLNSFYLVGKNYATGSDAFDNWGITDISENSSYKFNKATNVYSYKFTCTESAEMRFRLRQLADNATAFDASQWGPSGYKVVTMTAGTSVTLVSRGYGDNDGYLIMNLQAGNTYTIYFNIADNSIFYTESATNPASYKLVAKSRTSDKTFKMPMSQTRHRNSNSYNMNLWTAGFKSDLLPENGTYDIYIEKITENSNDVTYLYPNGNVGADQVPDLGLDYTNLKSVENVTYAESSTPQYSGKLAITKGEASSFTFALNLGSEIKNGCVADSRQTYSFYSAAHSITLYKNESISDVYARMYPGKYKGIDEKYYLIGQVDGAEYVPNNDGTSSYSYTNPKAPSYGNTYLMERKVFYKPGTTTQEVDSVVYSKVVRKTASGFNQLFLSFAPESLLDDAAGKDGGGTKYWIYKNYDGEEDGIASVNAKEAFNYNIRPEIFDEQDATAQMGSVFFRGSSTGKDYPEKTMNGGQALNPLILDSENYDYYIVRLNVTTSTYRIEFVKKENIKIPTSGIRTYCGQENLRLKSEELKNGVHIYAVHSYKEPEDKTYGERQGVLTLRALDYIPANEPVVLVVTNKDVLNSTTDGDGNITNWLDLEVMYDTDTDFTSVRQEWWKKYNQEEGYGENDPYNNYLVASLFGTTIENGEYDINEQGKYEYRARNFALNKFSNTKYFKTLYPTDKERQEFKDAGKDYYSFFRAKGTVKAGYAYLQLPNSVMKFDGQLLDHKEDDGDVKTFAKMALFFDDMESDVTGIEEVKTGSNAGVREDGAYYTLQGLKVEKPVKGLYIHNGKKVIIK